ncbi:IS701 family transposase [Saccharopolyspora rosea]|uniref:IS701 family transposase n=1 Tax=Saccharopolyspora rosea TaxID=524884 RepID=A0ABW3FW13_9PSEU|nr:IS701 family transposase [Saccharopolyspora rosea]
MDETIEVPATLTRFVQEVFASLPRLDQRRWAEVYVRGLLRQDGRKSARNIADAVLGIPVAQSLQQFVNQSPWDWRPVRDRLAALVAERTSPVAWVVHGTVIPKSGRYSVGVARRYVAEAGRTISCQVGKALFLADDRGGVPVDWRIALPASWDDDAKLRERARIPPEERSRPEWSYVLDLIGEQERRGADPAPVVVDGRHLDGVRELAGRLRSFRPGFVLQVDAGIPVELQDGHVAKVGECAQEVIRNRRPAVVWRGGRDVELGSYFLSVPVRLPAAGPRSTSDTPLRLIIQRSPEDPLPVNYWLTSLPRDRGEQAARLGGLVRRTEHDLRRLRLDFGLHDFEGRSFHGWHHYMTLVSAAYAYHCAF